MKNSSLKFLLIILLTLSACSGDSKKNFGTALFESNITHTKRMPDTTINLPCGDKTRAIYLLPAKSFMVKGNILLLHGWNLSPLGWCEQTTLCDELRNAGYNIIIPDMGKSMYASEVYPETMNTLADQPLRQWLTEDVFAFLNDSLNVLMGTSNNYLIGLSTGARGAFAIGLERPDLFDAAIVLSGDYDQTLMKDDNLMIYFYGDYSEYPERWEGKDNLLRRADEWTLPIYIGHAVEDPVVPFSQSDTLYKVLDKMGCVYMEGNFPMEFGHDYQYWESETENILKFIEAVEAQKMAAEVN
jgi:S-formylglutathione hydrolase FrmB